MGTVLNHNHGIFKAAEEALGNLFLFMREICS